MFEPGTRVFLRFEAVAGERVLHAGVILASRDGTLTGAFFVRDQAIEVGVPAFLYFACERDFLAQPVRVLTALPDDDGLRLEIERVGEPTSAEDRRDYRVSAITAGLSATIGDEDACEVIEISPRGFSIYARTICAIGDEVPLVLHFRGSAFAGTAIVTNAKAVSAKRVRYGLRTGSGDSDAGNFERDLARISEELQRDQLRRPAAF